jgi:hypothetical protein
MGASHELSPEATTAIYDDQTESVHETDLLRFTGRARPAAQGGAVAVLLHDVELALIVAINAV